MSKFSHFNLPAPLLNQLGHLGFVTPTSIQNKAIPPALQGEDILGSADTGTGKTAAFLIPLIVKLMTNKQDLGLILTPTRELAAQVKKQVTLLTHKKMNIKTVLLIGGEQIDKQIKVLRTNPRLIIGTPGRINDHLKNKNLSLSHSSTVVLDEMDRMLDMGFVDQIHDILKHTPENRQTLLFTATLPPSMAKLAQTLTKNPHRVDVSTPLDHSKLHHDVVRLESEDKRPKLLDLLQQRVGSVILFMKTKYATEKMAKFLKNSGFTSDALHGDLKQSRRERVTNNFRNQKFQILVATDVAARGLDIPHIEHVINFDLPQCPEDYIHRIGRTARAGRSGEAISFITPSDRRNWGAIAKLMNLETTSGFDYEFTDNQPIGQKKHSRNRKTGKYARNNQTKIMTRSRNTSKKKVRRPTSQVKNLRKNLRKNNAQQNTRSTGRIKHIKKAV